MSDLAIACASGAFKGVFIHGVLSALEEQGITAAAYGAVSSSALPAAYAAMQTTRRVGAEYWARTARRLEIPGVGMSQIVQETIDEHGPSLSGGLCGRADRPRLLVAASAVCTREAAVMTQGPQARRLGRKLLVAAAKRDSTWADTHLRLDVFDSRQGSKYELLDKHNFAEVLYATTRMLHAWDVPARIGGQPYVDGSYRCLCPVRELAALGYRRILAIHTDPGPAYTDFFQTAVIEEMPGVELSHVRPARKLEDVGVAFVRAEPAGLLLAYEEGFSRGQAWARE